MTSGRALSLVKLHLYAMTAVGLYVAAQTWGFAVAALLALWLAVNTALVMALFNFR